jgi:hypothetical protein
MRTNWDSKNKGIKMTNDQNKFELNKEDESNKSKKGYVRPSIESGETFEKSALSCIKAAGSCPMPTSS